MQHHILVVEDNPKVARGIRDTLRREGYEVSCCVRGQEAVALLQRQAAHLVLLDLGLPDGDGLDMMPELQDVSGGVPVLMLTARDGIDDRVKGLDAGAEDYLVKPFAAPELLARIRRILRQANHVQTELHCGDLRLNIHRQRAWLGEDPLELSPREFGLLKLLMEQKGRIVSRGMIVEEVWQAPNRFTPLDNVIQVCVSRLRDKIDRHRDTPMLLTIRGAGYMLKESP